MILVALAVNNPQKLIYHETKNSIQNKIKLTPYEGNAFVHIDVHKGKYKWK